MRRLLAPAVTALVLAAIINPFNPNEIQTAQAEPRPIERPVLRETKPEIRQIPTSRSQVRKPVVEKKVEKTAKKPAQKSTNKVVRYGWEAGEWSRFPAWVEQSARCIAKHESWHSGLWRAINPNTRISTASGFAQWINSTWRAQTARAGVGESYSRAVYAPPRVQAAVFAHQAMNHGLYPWNGTGCPGT